MCNLSRAQNRISGKIYHKGRSKRDRYEIEDLTSPQRLIRALLPSQRAGPSWIAGVHVLGRDSAGGWLGVG